MRTSSTFISCLEQLNASFQPCWEPLGLLGVAESRFPTWEATCISRNWDRATKFVHTVIDPADLTFCLGARKMQAALSKVLIPALRQESPDQFVARRLRRFVPELSDAAVFSF